jgi:error-prone DNA polymerase
VIEPDDSIRLGLLQVRGLRRDNATAMIAERERKPFASMDDFRARTSFSREELRTLATVGALNCLAPHRRAALWEAERVWRGDDLLSAAGEARSAGDASPLRPMDTVERLRADYDGLQLTTGPHPMALIRERLPDVWRAGDLPRARNGQTVRIAGQVICRQRPGTAKGFCFISLEDETGISNAIVTPALFESERLTITSESFLLIEGVAQNRHNTIHIKARKIARLDDAGLQAPNPHDFG